MADFNLILFHLVALIEIYSQWSLSSKSKASKYQITYIKLDDPWTRWVSIVMAVHDDTNASI